MSGYTSRELVAKRPEDLQRRPSAVPCATPSKVSLRSLVDDLLGSATDITVTKAMVKLAVERTKRSSVDKKGLMANLDILLEGEIRAGLFGKVGPDSFTLPSRKVTRSHNESRAARGQVATFKPVFPSPILSQLMQSSKTYENTVTLEHSVSASESSGQMSVPPLRLRRTVQVVKSASSRASYVREEWSLQQQTAPFKASGPGYQHFHSQMENEGAQMEANICEKSRKIFDPADHELPSRKRKACASPTSPPSGHSATLTATKTCTISATVVVPAPNASIEDISSMDSVSIAQVSDVVALERPTSSSVRLNDQLEIVSRRVPDFYDSFDDATSSIPKTDMCEACGGEADGTHQDLLRCKDCSACAHHSCRCDSFGLPKNINISAWQCSNCKTCETCQEAYDKENLVLCSSCDLGFHLTCISPPLSSRPNEWQCSICTPIPPRSTVESEINAQEKKSESAEVCDFMPVIPPQLHPAKGLLPPNWEDFPPDPKIPDVTEWNVKQVAEYFRQNGFSSEQVDSFLEKEIDGKSLLLLHRDDVIGALGLKLGPAVRVFSHITRLQTRRNFPVF